jgi:hypothetical protein
MSDPFSLILTIASAIGTAYTVSDTIHTFVGRVKDAPEDIQRMGKKVIALRSTMIALESKLKHDFNGTPPYPESYQQDMRTIIDNVTIALEQAVIIFEKLKMPDGKQPSTWHNLKTTIKVMWIEGDITKCNESITFYLGLIQIFLSLTTG